MMNSTFGRFASSANVARDAIQHRKIAMIDREIMRGYFRVNSLDS